MLESLQQSAFSQWMLGSTSIWAYPTILTLHTFGMMVLAGAAIVVDLRLLGFGRSIPLASIRGMFVAIWYGLFINAITGTLLFVADAAKRGTQPLFLAKLTLIAAGVAILFRIKRHLDAPGRDPVLVSRDTKLLAMASILVWSAAITAGRLLAYVG